MADPRLLVVEDDPAHAEALQMALENEHCTVELATSVGSALDRLRARHFDMVLTDLKLGAESGMDLLSKVRRDHPALSVILITGHGSVETAVRAMREGASDYLTKPVNLEELRARVKRELGNRRLVEDVRELRAALDKRYGLEGLVGGSTAMHRVFDLVRQAGRTEATVLILGESGTGKELIARALHNLSARAANRFVAINCAALTESLIESELFGHVRGAFTGAHESTEGKFEYAHGGTLFLDEIGDMPLSTQAKLLRVLENREVVPVGSNSPRPVDVRILAATNRDLRARVREGKFREDLFWRLAVVTVDLPPLRERLEDLPVLLDHFLRQFREQHQKEIRGVDEAILRRLRQHSWPGNVRELRNAVETMVVLDRDGLLGLEDLPPGLREGFEEAAPGPAASSASPAAPGPRPQAPAVTEAEAGYQLLGKSLAQVERDLIELTLKSLAGNRQKAAERLGMGERTLYRKIKDLGLD
jgi:two-component system response regulator HydG